MIKPRNNEKDLPHLWDIRVNEPSYHQASAQFKLPRNQQTF